MTLFPNALRAVFFLSLTFIFCACPGGSSDPSSTYVPPVDAGVTSNTPTSTCGDGQKEGDEVCDDGNNSAGDYCSADCLEVLGSCGDGTVQSNEVCDDGNTADGDYCSSDCQTANGACGDEELQSHEACDDGNTDDGDYCSADCTTVTGFCGDSTVQTNELCDDGNVQGGDGCTGDCERIEIGFSCTGTGPSLCLSECGDGVKASDESCEDGNADAGDGCSATCDVEYGFSCTIGAIGTHCISTCGDGIKASDEACDDGNTLSADGCAANCAATEEGFSCEETTGQTSTPGDADTECQNICGDGLIVENEVCDDGNTNDADGCSADCALVEYGYLCEENSNTGTIGSLCVSACGDGNVATDEACDDGNEDADDGCAGDCTIEYGFSCSNPTPIDSQPAPSSCSSTCGDGFVAFNEICDDGNLDDEEGCNATCSAAAYGFSCAPPASTADSLSPAPSQCVSTCADGVVASDEACDDDNSTDDDGCAADCSAVDYGFYCSVPSASQENTDGGVLEQEDADGGLLAQEDAGAPANTDGGSEEPPSPTASVCDSVCGDGKVASNETCDDGSNAGGLGCSADCQIEEVGYACSEDPAPTDPEAPNPSTCLSTCGDGVQASDEECDDGPEDPDAGLGNSDTRAGACRTTCEQARCGDGVVDPDNAEVCDDGNTEDRDACRNSCLEAICGDGVQRIDLGINDDDYEACDDGNAADEDACLSNCAVARCGDGVQASNEECDDGDGLNSDEVADACREDCLLPRCGDGTIDTNEACDDSNETNNDYCDATCAFNGFTKLTAGFSHTCGIRISGDIVCWGKNNYGQTDSPAGDFTDISAGKNHSCAIKSVSQEATCWGKNDTFVEQAPTTVEGTYISISAGDDHSCGIQTDRSANCWGNYGYFLSEPDFIFEKVVSGRHHSCGLTADSQIECWGNTSPTEPSYATDDRYLTPPVLENDQVFLGLSAQNLQTCALTGPAPVAAEENDAGVSMNQDAGSSTEDAGMSTEDAGMSTEDAGMSTEDAGMSTEDAGTSTEDAGVSQPSPANIVCWGFIPDLGIDAAQNTPPGGYYTDVSAGMSHGCGVLESGVVRCWGSGQGEIEGWGAGQSLPYGSEEEPAIDTFVQVVSGAKHSCGLRSDTTVVCWGLEGATDDGQADPPQFFIGGE